MGPCWAGSWAAPASRVGERQTSEDFIDGGQRKGKVSEDGIGKTATSGFGILRRRKTDPLRGPWKRPALKTRRDLAFRGGRTYLNDWSKTGSGVVFDETFEDQAMYRQWVPVCGRAHIPESRLVGGRRAGAFHGGREVSVLAQVRGVREALDGRN